MGEQVLPPRTLKVGDHFVCPFEENPSTGYIIAMISMDDIVYLTDVNVTAVHMPGQPRAKSFGFVAAKKGTGAIKFCVLPPGSVTCQGPWPIVQPVNVE